MVGLRRRKYAVLLALLFIAINTFNAQSGAERLRTDALRTVLGVWIWIVVFERPRERATMAVRSRVRVQRTAAIGQPGHSLSRNTKPAARGSGSDLARSQPD